MTTSRRTPSRAALAGALPLLLVLLSACATIPTSGPVHQGAELGADRDNQVRNIAFAPSPGASRQTIVRGFLRGMGDFLDDHAVARKFLAPAVRQQWTPFTGTSVYDRQDGVTVALTPDGQVTFSATEIARIDADGRYRRVPPGTIVRRTFRMTKVHGEWRIADAPEGLVLSEPDLVAYRTLNLYFLAPTATLVVPDPVLMPNLPGMPTKLVARLLRGPTTDLRGAVDTAFPKGTALDVSAVQVRDGLATVNLNAAALKADPDARTSMSAQIVWTLKQVAGIQRIRILADGHDLVTTGVNLEQPIDAWSGYDPDAVSTRDQTVLSREGRILVWDGAAAKAWPGPAGAVGAGLRLPSTAIDGQRLAAVTADRSRLVTARNVATSPLTQSAPLGLLTRPSWDRGGDLWVVDAAGGRLLLKPDGEVQARQVALAALPAGRLTAARVSRDGTRIALVAGVGPAARLFVGSIRRSPTGAVASVSGVYEPMPGLLSGVQAVSWNDAAHIMSLGVLSASPAAPVVVDVDGQHATGAVSPQPGLVTITIAPGKPLLASTDAGKVLKWDPNGVGWQAVLDGRDPSYPG